MNDRDWIFVICRDALVTFFRECDVNGRRILCWHGKSSNRRLHFLAFLAAQYEFLLFKRFSNVHHTADSRRQAPVESLGANDAYLHEWSQNSGNSATYVLTLFLGTFFALVFIACHELRSPWWQQ